MTTLRSTALTLAALGLIGGVALAVPRPPKAPPAPAAAPAAPAPVAWAAPPPPDPPEPPEPPEAPEPWDGDSVWLFQGDGGGRLGVFIDDVGEEKAADLKLGEPHGALVTEVDEEGPAAKAGLRKNDVIVSYQGQRVEGAAALRRMVRETPPGRTVRVGISRDGSERTVDVEIGERRIRERRVIAPRIEIPKLDLKLKGLEDLGRFRWHGHGPRLGVAIQELNPQLGEYFGVKSGEGVLVTEVMEGMPAEKAGVKAGDVIVRVDDQEIDDLGDLHEALDGGAGKTITLTVIRGRAEKSLSVTLEDDEEDDATGRRSMSRRLHQDLRREIERSAGLKGRLAQI